MIYELCEAAKEFIITKWPPQVITESYTDADLPEQLSDIQGKKPEKVPVPHVFKGKQPKFSLGKITNKYLIIDIIHYGIARRDIVMTFYKLSK